MEPWYKVVQPRPEVTAGRSFNPDEFAVLLEQVIGGTAPEDYRDPRKFFARTSFTRALREHSSMILRRLSGQTVNAAPVLTLITQFGGGKTHTLAALYHLIRHPAESSADPGVADLLNEAGQSAIPEVRVAVFVGNAWDPTDTRETPWIDIARQLAGDEGAAALGAAARTTPPGTAAIERLIERAGGSVLILFDEVLNYLDRHRDMASGFHSFIQNLTVAITGTTRSAAVISLPRSQVEMSEWEADWQDKITKVVRRVAKDLIANDEAEISEVVRRRLFDELGRESQRKVVSRTYADWCFQNRAQLPREWTAVDTSTTEAKARDFLRSRFEACYPFHPATISVFQRKWQSLAQFQQTRGTLAMFAQWISIAFRQGYQNARREPLITLGSAPLDVEDFRGVILGQLGEPRMLAAIEVDIAGPQSHARALDSDTKGPLKDIHRRVGNTILFESSGGQSEKVAHLPELRFALGEPDVDAATIDNAALALETKGFYIRKAGSDGFRFGFKPTLKKVVSDRRASLDEAEVRKATERLVSEEFQRGAGIPVLRPFPKDGASVEDSPRLSLVILDPEQEWSEDGELRTTLAEWTKRRGKGSRLYPASLIWCAKKQGRELRAAVENWIAWQRVKMDVGSGILGHEFDRSELAGIGRSLADAQSDAKDEIWASYRHIVLADLKEPDGLKHIDLGAGHSSSGESLCGRVLAALKSQALLNESPGAGYLQRKWPPAFKESGAWPLKSLRQAFLDGSLDRLVNPDEYLRRRIPDFVARGEFAFASGSEPDGGYKRIWFKEALPANEVAFDSDVYLLTRERAKAFATKPEPAPDERKPDSFGGEDGKATGPDGRGETEPTPEPSTAPDVAKRTVEISGSIPPEVWNRLGTRLIPKLRAGTGLRLGLDFSVELGAPEASQLVRDLKQAFSDLNLASNLTVKLR